MVRSSGTVDGRNPAPLGMYKNPVNNEINDLSTGAGFLPSTVWLEGSQIYATKTPPVSRSKRYVARILSFAQEESTCHFVSSIRHR